MTDHPIRLVVTDDLRRSRLTVFFRYLLTFPHMVWLMLWGFAAFFVLFVSWWATLFAGHTPQGLHDFLARFARYNTRVTAYMLLLANPFPPFSSGGAYPVDLEIAPPAAQNRAKTFFRPLLAFPALWLGYPLTYALMIAATFSWFASLVLGRNPVLLQRVGCYALKYTGQANGYVFLLTDRYPDGSAPE